MSYISHKKLLSQLETYFIKYILNLAKSFPRSTNYCDLWQQKTVAVSFTCKQGKKEGQFDVKKV